MVARVAQGLSISGTGFVNPAALPAPYSSQNLWEYRKTPSNAGAMGTLDILILARLARGSMHGFGIADYLHQVSDALHVDEGSLYPAKTIGG